VFSRRLEHSHGAIEAREVSTHVDEFFLALVLRTPGLIFEDHIVIPASLHGKVLLVEQRVTKRNISLSGFLLGFGAFGFLRAWSVFSQRPR
jgi:apolipoprotein N-acyltransferase